MGGFEDFCYDLCGHCEISRIPVGGSTCQGQLPFLAGVPFTILVWVMLVRPHSWGISTRAGQSCRQHMLYTVSLSRFQIQLILFVTWEPHCRDSVASPSQGAPPLAGLGAVQALGSYRSH